MDQDSGKMSLMKQYDSRMISSDPEIHGSLEIGQSGLEEQAAYFNERRIKSAQCIKFATGHDERRRCSMIGGLRVEKDTGGFTIAGFFFSKYFSIIMIIMGFLFVIIGFILIWICFVAENGETESKKGMLSVEKTEISKENKILGPICMLVGAGMLLIGGFFGFISWKVYKCDARKTNYVFGNTEVRICERDNLKDTIDLISVKSKGVNTDIEPIKFDEKGTTVSGVGCPSSIQLDHVPRSSSSMGNKNVLIRRKRNNSLPLLKGIRSGGSKVGIQGSSWFADEEDKKSKVFSLFRQELFTKYNRRDSDNSTKMDEMNCQEGSEEIVYERNGRRRSDIACFPKQEHTGEFFNNYFSSNDKDECLEPQEESPSTPKLQLIMEEIKSDRELINSTAEVDEFIKTSSSSEPLIDEKVYSIKDDAFEEAANL